MDSNYAYHLLGILTALERLDMNKDIATISKVMALQEKGLLTEMEMYTEVLEIAVKGLNGLVKEGN